MEARTWRLRRPRLGSALGGLALFVALQGTAFAVGTVDSGDIINGQVFSRDIATDGVRAADINAGAVHASELAATWIVGSGSSVTAGTAGTATATCPVDAQVISGGFHWDLDVAGLHTTSLELDTFANSATVTGFNDTAFNRTLSARVYCIVA